MKIAKGEGDLSGVKLGLLLREALLLRQVLEELTTLDELHDEVNAVGLLKDVVHADDKRMVNLVKDEFLDLEGLDGLVLDNYVFSYTLHCVELILELVLDEVNFPEGAPANN